MKYFIKEFKEDDAICYEGIVPYNPDEVLLDEADALIVASCKGLTEVWAVQNEVKGLETLKEYYDDVVLNIYYLVCYPTDIVKG